jgi:hypothetical protein
MQALCPGGGENSLPVGFPVFSRTLGELASTFPFLVGLVDLEGVFDGVSLERSALLSIWDMGFNQ